jgi:hypothetical protein
VIPDDDGRGGSTPERASHIEAERIRGRDPGAAASASTGALVLEEPFESVQLGIRRDSGGDPLGNFALRDRLGRCREHCPRCVPAPHPYEAKIGQKDGAVKPKTLSHQ